MNHIFALSVAYMHVGKHLQLKIAVKSFLIPDVEPV